MNMSKVLDIKAKFNTLFLVSKLVEHRTNHLEEYKNAYEGYKTDLKKLAVDLKKETLRFIKGDNVDYSKVSEAHYKLTSLQKPVNAAKMYDQYIDMLSTTTDTEITLSVSDANSIINDSWDWAVSAKLANSYYTASSFR